ncbi:competence protein CoiA family protein [Paenibacillus sp. TAF58]
MYHAIYEGKLFNIEQHLQTVSMDRSKEIDTLKKRADKGAFNCPHCNEQLIVKAGDIRGVFFSHSSGKSCLLTESSETYKNQVKRESKNHSAIREIVHEVLKNQEKIRPDLQVEYGYIAKAKEKWSQFPDIVLKNQGKELAISILTNVDRSKDNKLSKQIKKRNDYFREHGLQTLWFIEEPELSLDFENKVMHLWESEIDLAVKSTEDLRWDEFLLGLSDETFKLFQTFGFWSSNKDVSLDTRSLYYVFSTQEGIDFSVHRFIIDETQFPFRAFALSEGYRMSISTALSFDGKLALSDPKQEITDRQRFHEEFNQRNTTAEYQQEVDSNQSILTTTIRSGSTPESSHQNSTLSYTELKSKLYHKLGMTQKEQVRLWHTYVLKYGIRQFDEIWLLAEQLETFEQLELALLEYLA